MTDIHLDPARRHDFVLLFDITDGNPNGDPDAGNLPRVDPETMQGLVTDVAIKRKVRDYVDALHGAEPRTKIYVQHEQYLTDQRKWAFEQRGADPKKTSTNDARTFMTEEFFDIRMFGAVLSLKEYNAGQVRGPLQLTFARSIDRVVPLEVAIVGPAQKAGDNRPSEGDDTAYGTMGRKALIPYGLYRGNGFYNPHFAARTGVTTEDLALFWEALQNMWDLDRSASRGLTACRGIYVFSHDSKLGNAPAHRLLELVRTPASDAPSPRKIDDYTISAPPEGPLEGIPGVTLTVLGR